jgi:uncharacterized protein YkwD
MAGICLITGGTLALATPTADASPLQASYSAYHHRHHHRHHRRNHHRHHANKGPGASTASAGGGGPWSATKPCVNADTPATSGTLTQMTDAVNCLINQQRLIFGLPPLNISSELNSAAQSWTQTMVSTGNFSHANLGSRLSAAGYNWSEGGENIATGYITPRDVVSGWLASPDHCSNILDPDYASMGTGESASPVGNYAATPATWTQDFGVLMGQNSPSSDYGPANGCPYTIPASPNG